MLDIREYQDRAGRNPFRKWFDGLDAEAAQRVTTALYRLGLGNLSKVKGVGSGVHEYKIDFGPGYHVYFGLDGEQLVILLAGGSKQQQERDIQLAIERWRDYRQRKRQQDAR